MELNLTYKLILIALDDENGKFITDTAHLHYGIAGSILLELALQNKIALEEGKVIVANKDDTTSPCLNKALQLIDSDERPGTVGHWISLIGLGAEEVKDQTIEHLTKENILRKDAGKILWIIPTTSFPTEDPYLENQIRERLLNIVINDGEARLKDLMLLSLIEESDLVHEVFKSKEEYKKAKERLKSLPKDIQNAEKTNQNIQAIHAAVSEGIISAIINSSNVSTTSD